MRKRNAVIRWGVSTWYLQNKYGGDEEGFKAKLGLGDDAKNVSFTFFWLFILLFLEGFVLRG